MDISQELQNFCSNVTYLRKKHGLTQAQMAEIMDVGVGTVRTLERGTVPPRLSAYVLRRLCDHFHISADTLIAPSGKLHLLTPQDGILKE